MEVVVVSDSVTQKGSENAGLSSWQVVLLFGLISLVADAVYEGARSIIPTYLEVLGASAVIVGTIIGIAEFIGYVFRVISGKLTDKWQNPWPFVLSGYGILIVVPLLALTGHWAVALLLLIVERLGKSVRGPARDTILSSATRTEHAGKVFGFHELLDQTGAVLGPLLAVIILFYSQDDFRLAFLGFSLPYVILLVILILTYVLLKNPVEDALNKGRSIQRSNEFEKAKNNNAIISSESEETLPRSFYYYALAVFFNITGLIHFSILLLMVNDAAKEVAWIAAAAYLLIQAVDAVVAPIWGTVFDRINMRILALPLGLSIVPSLFLINPSLPNLLLAAAVFGIVLAAQESIYRAGVSHLIPVQKRGTAYGYLYVMMGMGSLLSGAVFGFFLEQDLLPLMVVFSIILQGLALTCWMLLEKSL